MAWVHEMKQFCNCTGSRRAKTSRRCRGTECREAVPKSSETRPACSCRRARCGPRNRRRRWWRRWRWPGCPPVCGVGCAPLGDRPTRRNARGWLPWVVAPCPFPSTMVNESWHVSIFLKNQLRRDCPDRHRNCSRLRGSDRLSTGIAYLATALGTAKKSADLINSEQLLYMHAVLDMYQRVGRTYPGDRVRSRRTSANNAGISDVAVDQTIRELARQG